jgi:DNA-binding response OmpR family regulator
MKSDAHTVLIVEDEEALLMGLEQNVKEAGYNVLTAKDGKQALEKARTGRPDLILLDVMIPEVSGFEVCRQLRDSGASMPIIMLTARNDEFDKVHGFEMGADDYVTKPFSINELLARLKAVLKRGKRVSSLPPKFEFGDCVLDTESRILSRQGKELTLTRTEFDLLAYLCSNEGKALSREQVMSDVWGTEYYGTQRSLDSFIANLRQKIEKKAAKPKFILTVHGVGYKFVNAQ